MKIQFLIILLGAIKTGSEEENDLLCKRELVESYNLSAYLNPRNEKFYLCPSMKNTCCSNYDQFKMYNTWHINALPEV